MHLLAASAVIADMEEKPQAPFTRTLALMLGLDWEQIRTSAYDAPPAQAALSAWRARASVADPFCVAAVVGLLSSMLGNTRLPMLMEAR